MSAAGPAFAPGRGVLRLPAGAVAALAELARRPPDAAPDDSGRPSEPDPDPLPDPEHVALLRELGALDADDRPDDRLAPITAALARPLAAVSLRTGHPAPALAVRVWLGTGPAVVSLPTRTVPARDAPPRPDPDSLRTVAAAHPTAVPDLLARVLSVGPRPAPPVGPQVLPAAALRGLLAAAAGGGRGAAVRPGGEPDGHTSDRHTSGADPTALLAAAGLSGPARRALARLAAAARATWAASCRWPTADERPARRQLQVIDGGAAGWWRHEPASVDGTRVARLSPATGRDVYRALTALIPTPAELRLRCATVPHPTPNTSATPITSAATPHTAAPRPTTDRSQEQPGAAS